MKKIAKILIIFLLTVPLTSCWDSQDLEELLIVYGIGIDVSDENPEKYVVTIEFPTVIDEAPESKYQISAKVNSLSDAKSNFQLKVYRKISYGNTRVIVFSEEAAKQGIMKHIDCMLREPIFPGTTRFAVSDIETKELFDMDPPVSLFISTYLFRAIEQSHNATQVPFTTLRNFHHQYFTSGIDPILPYIKYDADTNITEVSSTALFKGDQLIHILMDEYSRFLMILKGEILSGFFVVNNEDVKDLDGNLGIRFTGGNTKIKTELRDSELYINQTVKIDANLTEYTRVESVFNVKKIQEIETILSKYFKDKLLETAKQLQELKTDSVGYGLYVRANHPDFFDAITWADDFSNATINIDVKLKIDTVGITH
ncbi:Ger(x)C family spore germination protein [Alkaliphilus hydrothermalis]|uniref:Ger(X)C family germination protein n=1 Tax=Alkaliphilus hydrothermalis TaxID=1482730 RepID=A0ABS2NS27_9FIRM|nr:Ger(x)C family spore germination protein [Alkaliphilus hydrothermalis]MBM7615765.1 Ger(x)C family germination protein [Alkaliphilus hydrothermalis]